MICVCGNNRYFAHQVIRAEIIVDEKGSFHSNVNDSLEKSIYDSGTPYEPFTCTKCGKEYEKLE